MFTRFQVFTVILLTLTSAIGQTNEPAPSSAPSGLQLRTQTDEERIEFLMSVADAYFENEEYAQAVNAYERILEIDPKHDQARFIVAHVYINAKQYDKAEQMMMELSADYPENYKLFNNLAWLYATAEDPAVRDGAKAVKYAQQAMVMAPNDHHIWSTLSEAYYVSGEYEKAYRAINHMAQLAARYAKDLTKENVDDYNEQIRKCKRAMDTEAAIKGDDDESASVSEKSE
jgi:tetratricopeptide (TPR) repeat protein